MDRDRDRRRVDIPPEDRFGTGGGQSYRPSHAARERSPPRADTYRARSPSRRDFDSRAGGDSYRARQRTRSPPPPRRDDYRRRTPSPPRYRDPRDSRDVRDAVPRGGDSYRGGRARSPPPRREDLPRDDLFRREPARDDRAYRDARDYRDDRERAYPTPADTRSPLPRYRDRSAVPLKRTRDPSPRSSRGGRTPPPKRERLVSPPRASRYDDYAPSRGISPPRRRYSPDPRDRRASPARGMTRDYRPAGRSRSPPPREERVDPRAVDDWRRPRSPLRDSRNDYLSREESAINSGATSRRSSPPPLHLKRTTLVQGYDDAPRSARASPRDPYGDREPYRAGDEPRRAGYEREDTEMYDREPAYEDAGGYAASARDVPPPREPRRDDDAPLPIRAPPTGPSSQRMTSTSMAPPTGPAGMPPSGPRVVSGPPAGPRGVGAPRGDFVPRGRGGYRGDFAPRGRGGFRGGFDNGYGGRGGFDGGRGGALMGPAAGFGRGDAGFARSTSETFSQAPAFGDRQPPSGPRGSYPQAQAQVNNFTRQTSASATPMAPTGPRGQRFTNSDTAMPDAPTGPKAARRPTEPHIPTGPAASRSQSHVHPALQDLPKIIEGGQKADPILDRSKLGRLEDEAEKLRRQIEEKEMKKRKGLREWQRLQRETEAAALRSELAEEALRELNGEAESQAAF